MLIERRRHTDSVIPYYFTSMHVFYAQLLELVSPSIMRARSFRTAPLLLYSNTTDLVFFLQSQACVSFPSQANILFQQ